ncbi:MAG: T9SS type A sorting domain-containing protein [Opitutaceae bacterium]|nr:T9SS type A sorting domain-containing protein [Cytophagales bacterium]
MKNTFFSIILFFISLSVIAQTDTLLCNPGEMRTFTPGKNVYYYDFSLKGKFDPVAFEEVDKESVRIFNYKHSFYPNSDVTLTTSLGVSYQTFSALLPDDLDTGYYHIAFRYKDYQAIIKNCIYISKTNPDSKIKYGYLTSTAFKAVKFEVRIEAQNLDLSLIDSSTCYSRLKIKPSDFILQQNAVTIKADSVAMESRYYNEARVTFHIPKDAPSGIYNLRLQGDAEKCKTKVDTHTVFVYCDTVNASINSFYRSAFTLEKSPGCIGNPVKFSFKEEPGFTYKWSSPPFSSEREILSSTTNQITLKSSYSEIGVVLERENKCGKWYPVQDYLLYDILPASPSVKGPQEVCKNSTELYTLYKNTGKTINTAYGYNFNTTWNLTKGGGIIYKQTDGQISIGFFNSSLNDTLVTTFQNSCGIKSISLPIKIGESPTKPEVFERAYPFVLSSTVINAKKYQWFKNGEAIQGATDSVYSPPLNYNMQYYQVQIEDECGVAISDSLYALITAIESNEFNKAGNFQISPNPVQDKLLITTDLSFTEYSILSNSGNIIKANEKLNSHEIEVSGIDAGFYFLELRGKSGSVRKKFIVTK